MTNKDDYTIEVQLDTYVSFKLLSRELRNKYYREKEISDKLGIDCKLVVNHYGVLFEGHELDRDELVVSRVKEHFKELNKRYFEMRHKRQESPVKRIYGAKPGTKLNDSLAKAFHNANVDIANYIKENIQWELIDFYYSFNSIEYPFNPLEINGFQKLTKQVKANIR